MSAKIRDERSVPMDFKSIMLNLASFLGFVGDCTMNVVKGILKFVLGGTAKILGKLFGTVFGWMKKKLNCNRTIILYGN